jgi:predicted RNase H-like HicB family nuclease
MKTEKRDLSCYLKLPYTKILRPDEDGDVVAQIQELPGCSAHGVDEKEALANLDEAQRLWLQDCLEAGDIVPEPEQLEPLPSGKWVQRVPRSLHQKLAKLAQHEGVSLNQLVTQMLAEKFGARAAERSAAKVATLRAKRIQNADEAKEEDYAPTRHP